MDASYFCRTVGRKAVIILFNDTFKIQVPKFKKMNNFYSRIFGSPCLILYFIIFTMYLDIIIIIIIQY